MVSYHAGNISDILNLSTIKFGIVLFGPDVVSDAHPVTDYILPLNRFLI